MNRQHFPALFSVIILAFTVFSCGNSDNEGSENQIDFQRTDNSVAIRVLNDADVLNPMLSSINTSTMISDQVFQYMLTNDPETLDLVPQLAKSRPAVENLEDGPYKGGLKFTFEIHEEAVWDDGTPVTGEDYVFTVKLLKIPGLANQNISLYTAFLVDAEVDADNPKKFHVYYNERSWQAEEIAGNLFHIMPKHIYDENGLLDDIPLRDLSDTEKAAQLVESSDQIKQFMDAFSDPKFSREIITGCGPYEFEEWVTGQRIVINKKDNWWGKDLAPQFPGLQAFPDQIIIRPIPEDPTAITAIKSEEIDVVVGIPPADYVEMVNNEIVTDKYNLFTTEQLAHYFLYVNTEKSQLSDKRVRRALAHSLNVDTIINQVYKGFGKRPASPVHPMSPDYNKSLSPIDFNPQKAIALLEEAGWKDSNNNGIVDKTIDGKLTELSIEYGLGANRPTAESVGLLIKDFALKVGIDIQLVPLELTQWVARLNQRDYDLYSGGLRQQIRWNPRQIWHSTGPNRTAFGNAQMDEMIDKAELIMDVEERRLIYNELQRIINDEQPIISLMIPQSRMAIHKRFETPFTPIYPSFFPNLVKLKKELVGNK